MKLDWIKKKSTGSSQIDGYQKLFRSLKNNKLQEIQLNRN